MYRIKICNKHLLLFCKQNPCVQFTYASVRLFQPKLAETWVRSSRKLFILIIEKYFIGLEYSKQKLFSFENLYLAPNRHLWNDIWGPWVVGCTQLHNASLLVRLWRHLKTCFVGVSIERFIVLSLDSLVRLWFMIMSILDQIISHAILTQQQSWRRFSTIASSSMMWNNPNL